MLLKIRVLCVVTARRWKYSCRRFVGYECLHLKGQHFTKNMLFSDWFTPKTMKLKSFGKLVSTCQSTCRSIREKTHSHNCTPKHFFTSSIKCRTFKHILDTPFDSWTRSWRHYRSLWDASCKAIRNPLRRCSLTECFVHILEGNICDISALPSNRSIWRLCSQIPFASLPDTPRYIQHYFFFRFNRTLSEHMSVISNLEMKQTLCTLIAESHLTF
jgi:hypothetical protein